jgi:YihY family inner membrane protein
MRRTEPDGSLLNFPHRKGRASRPSQHGHCFTADWWGRKLRIFADALVYLFGREGAVLVSAVTFNFFLSVFPIIVLLLSAANYLEWSNLREAVLVSLREFFPVSQDFIVRNMRIYTSRLGRPQLISLLLIAWTGSAFFFSLQASLDSAFRARLPRSFLRSQLLGIGMVLISGGLALGSISLADWLRVEDTLRLQGWSKQWAGSAIAYLLSFLLALTLFVNAYLWLPSSRRPFRSVMRTSFVASLFWLGINEFFRRLASSWSLEAIYGPFSVSITILFWAFATGCVVIGFARLDADGFFGD